MLAPSSLWKWGQLSCANTPLFCISPNISCQHWMTKNIVTIPTRMRISFPEFSRTWSEKWLLPLPSTTCHQFPLSEVAAGIDEGESWTGHYFAKANIVNSGAHASIGTLSRYLWTYLRSRASHATGFSYSRKSQQPTEVDRNVQPDEFIIVRHYVPPYLRRTGIRTHWFVYIDNLWMQ